MTLAFIILTINALIILALIIAHAMRAKNTRYRVLTRDLGTNDHLVYYVEARNAQEAATLIHEMLQDDGINSIILKVTVVNKAKSTP